MNQISKDEIFNALLVKNPVNNSFMTWNGAGVVG
jgi:hypothetical protein